jgi:bifunctional enzyme CysN/CysC
MRSTPETDSATAGQLRFFTCGSVDDGKSTLIGRLLHDTGNITDDQRAALHRDSAKLGSGGASPDFSLLTDGLEDEREQGITIDVGFRYFSTPRRSFVVADTPGHEQYTRNMATGASTSQLAVLVVDARKGVLEQTRRHAVIASIMGIRQVVLVVNKMDLVDWSQSRFSEIEAAFRSFAEKLHFASIEAVPVSAVLGDNVAARGAKAVWYAGPTLLDILEKARVDSTLYARPFRLPVQNVIRHQDGTRFYAGTVESGLVSRGDKIAVSVSGRVTTIAEIVAGHEQREIAKAGEAVAIRLTDQVDVGRGDLLALPDSMPHVADQFTAHIVWMHDTHLLPGRSYLMKIGPRTVPVTVTAIKHRIAIDTLESAASKTLELNEIGVCNFAAASLVAFDSFAESPGTGGFILIDRFTNETLAAGMIDFALRRGENIRAQQLDVSKQMRAGLKLQRPVILWFTGLSGAGKSTIANHVEQKLAVLGRHSYMLDGDNVRSGLNKDLGFRDIDRVENIRRVGEVAKLFVDAGLIVLCSFISPFRSERLAVRELVAPGEFVEIFVSAPLDVCEARDPKGLYAKSRSGSLPNFTGIDSPYEHPKFPELELDSSRFGPEQLADRVLAYLSEKGYFSSGGSEA